MVAQPRAPGADRRGRWRVGEPGCPAGARRAQRPSNRASAPPAGPGPAGRGAPTAGEAPGAVTKLPECPPISRTRWGRGGEGSGRPLAPA